MKESQMFPYDPSPTTPLVAGQDYILMDEYHERAAASRTVLVEDQERPLIWVDNATTWDSIDAAMGQYDERAPVKQSRLRRWLSAARKMVNFSRS